MLSSSNIRWASLAAISGQNQFILWSDAKLETLPLTTEGLLLCCGSFVTGRRSAVGEAELERKPSSELGAM